MWAFLPFLICPHYFPIQSCGSVDWGWIWGFTTMMGRDLKTAIQCICGLLLLNPEKNLIWIDYPGKVLTWTNSSCLTFVFAGNFRLFIKNQKKLLKNVEIRDIYYKSVEQNPRYFWDNILVNMQCNVRKFVAF
jgi:hypothetical protein